MNDKLSVYYFYNNIFFLGAAVVYLVQVRFLINLFSNSIQSNHDMNN